MHVSELVIAGNWLKRRFEAKAFEITICGLVLWREIACMRLRPRGMAALLNRYEKKFIQKSYKICYISGKMIP